MPLSINGFQVLTTGSALLKTGTVPGTDVRITMRYNVLPLFLAYASDYNLTIARLRRGECGAYSYRLANAGNGAWSDHSSGTALDLNWAHEGRQGASPTNYAWWDGVHAATMRVLLGRYKVTMWGGPYPLGGSYHQSQNWDYMHTAIRAGVTPAQISATIAVLGINEAGVAHPPHLVPTFPGGIIRRGARGPVVKELRLRFGFHDDSDLYDIPLANAIRTYQRKYLALIPESLLGGFGFHTYRQVTER